MRGEAYKRGRGTYACLDGTTVPWWIKWVSNSHVSWQDLSLITTLVFVIKIIRYKLSIDIR